jgi:uncharacterized protein (DUF983 family)
MQDRPLKVTNSPSAGQSLLRGVALKCPNCGNGRLFGSYLKQRGSCEECHESFEEFRPDDGPAWLTIGIVGLIVVPLLIILERNGSLSYGQEFSIISLTAVATALLMLPRSKGFFIAALWVISKKPGSQRSNP